MNYKIFRILFLLFLLSFLINSCDWFKRKDKLKNEPYTKFLDNFPETKLPFYLDETIISKNTNVKSLDNNLINLFLEKNYSEQSDSFSYYPVNKFNIGNLNCIVYLKERKTGTFFSEYYLNIYTKGVKLSTQLIGSIIGDCKNLTIIVSNITKDKIIYILEKKVKLSDDCKKVISSEIISNKDYHIDKNGNIILNTITVGNSQ